MSCLEKCSSDILVIFKHVIGIMDLSDKDLSHIQARALTAQEKRQKKLLTGLFPGRVNPCFEHST